MRNAFVYDAVMAPFERTVLAHWRRDAFADARGCVLEIGGGTGCTLPHYAHVERVVLTDPSPSMLSRSRPRSERVGFPVATVAADGMRLPFQAASFDTVVVSLALCTVPDPEQALREMARVLRPAGELRLLEHIRVPHGATVRIQDALTPLWKRISGGCHLNRATIEAAERCGYRIEEIRYGMGGWLVAARLKRPEAGS
jgi:ubiquinone/menaquinone biosynthesis C-methylase UbiE